MPKSELGHSDRGLGSCGLQPRGNSKELAARTAIGINVVGTIWFHKKSKSGAPLPASALRTRAQGRASRYAALRAARKCRAQSQAAATRVTSFVTSSAT